MVPLLYTSPPNTVTVVKKLTLVNVDASGAHLVTLYLVPSGGAPNATSILLDQFSVGPLQTVDVTVLVNQILAAGDFISAFADAPGLVNVRISGVQIS